MSLTFQQKLVLENGSVALYHEGKLQSGEAFHILILVPGKNIESYFQYIADQENFAVRTLESYGQILHCDVGLLKAHEIEALVGKLGA